MASRIQIARGQIKHFEKGNPNADPEYGPQRLAEGELFWQKRNVSNDAEREYKEEINDAWDEGTLWIGHPFLDKRGPEDTSSIDRIAIGGTRTIKSLVYRHKLTTQINLYDPTFEYARVGDFFIWANDAPSTQPPINNEDESLKNEFKNTYDFRRDDILLILEAPYDEETGKTFKDEIRCTKIDCSGGNAYQTRFDNTDTNFKATNVQDALEELESEKLKYIGSISSQEQFNHLGKDGDGLGLEIGGLYLLVSDGIVVTPLSKHAPYKVARELKKGDFAFYIGTDEGWGIIPSGYTDSEDIDYDKQRALDAVTKTGTFNETHKSEISKLTNVKEALDFLISRKAQLDDSGKVPLSQLHDTVLGAMQYMGTWDPLLNGDKQGEHDVNFQSPWPTGIFSPSEEGAGIHAGDYYIVKTSGLNIQYVDPDSNGKRILELNNGDWIVYSSELVPDVNAGGSYHWSVIDNTDRITNITFTINGESSTGEALELKPAVDKVVVGSPSFAASDKLVIWDDNGKMTVAGVRLVSQKKDENGKEAALPRYASGKNFLENSNIFNYDNHDGEGPLTLFYSNVSVGDASNTFHAEVHGNISLQPQISMTDKKAYEDSHIEFVAPKEPGIGTDLVTTPLKAMNVRVNPYFEDQAQVYLPEKSSTIIGKLKGITLVSGRITKVSEDGYVDNTSIEEIMGQDAEGNVAADNIHIHAPTLSVNHTELKHIVFGEKDSTAWENGHHPANELKSHLWQSLEQVDSNIEVFLPAESGTLITSENFDDLINGDQHILPVFGDKLTISGKKRSTLINSNIEQAANALFNTISRTQSELSPAERELYDKKYNNGTILIGEDGLPVIDPATGLPQRVEGQYDIEDTVVKSNLVVGGLSTDDYGKKYAPASEAKNVLVTGNFIMGNDNTNTTIIHPDRTFLNDEQYKNIFTGEDLPLSEVHVDMPTASGVLLTSNSRVDGGIWV